MAALIDFVNVQVRENLDVRSRAECSDDLIWNSAYRMKGNVHHCVARYIS
jgi:hypothetical protein